MRRASWRQRSDGVYQIVGAARRARRAALAFATLLVAVAMGLAVVSATAVYVVIGFPFLVAVAALLIVRRASQRVSRPGTPSATVLTLSSRKPSVAVPARDTGA